MIQGVDVSHYQSVAAVRLAILGGARFVFVKTSDGLSSDNPNGVPMHDAQVTTVRNNKSQAGHYHFARHADQYQAEADNFLNRANPQPGDLLALDLEDMGGAPWSQVVAYACSWLQYVSVKTAARPFWYVNDWWRSSILNAATAGQRQLLAKFPLWYATGGKPAGQPGISGWTIHQFSTAGGIDHDVAAVDLSPYAIPGGDDLSAADVAAINAHIDQVIGRVFASLSHGELPDGSAPNGVGHDQLLAAIKGTVTGGPANPPAAGDVDLDALAAKVVDLLAARLKS